MPKHDRKQKVPGRCIFCLRAGDLSKEHLWPEWMHDLIRLPNVRHANISHHIIGSKTKGILSATRKEQQGHVTVRKLRVVCRKCNSTWMGVIEQQAKHILIPLIKGDSGHLTQAMQRTLARWATLKVMIAEQNQPDEVVFSDIDREQFRLHGAIPPGVNLWMARCFVPLWRNAFLRCSGHLAVSQTLPPTVLPASDKKNTQTTALGVGELFLYAIVDKAEGVNLHNIIRVQDYLLPLHPSASDLALPLTHILPPNVPDEIAMAYNRLVNSANVHHYDISVKA